MSTIADLLIKVRADTAGAEKDITSLGQKVGGGFHKALIPAVAALGGLGVIGKAAFDNLRDGANNAAQTTAVLKSTGDASNVTAQHVDDLAMSLRRKAGVDDDVVHSGENMLLTFTGIRNEVGKGNDIFDQATKVMLDMSKALGQDTKSSAIQLGKALNDPIKGVTALQRVGVSFTSDQKKQIKALVDSGKTMQAQKLILHELNKEFGGSAEAIDPTVKAMANLKLDATDVASTLLQAAMPALQGFVGLLSSATRFMTEHATATKIVVGAIALLAGTVVLVNGAMALYSAGATVVRGITAAWAGVQWLLNAALSANPIGIVVVALAALAAALVLAWQHSQTFRDIVLGVWDAVRNAVQGVVSWFTTTVPNAFNTVLGWVRANWPIIATLVSGPFAPLVALATNAFGVRSALTGAFTAAKEWVAGNWPIIATIISGPFAPLVALATNAFGVRTAFTNGIEAILGWVRGNWPAIATVISGPFAPIVALATNAFGVRSALVSAFEGAMSSVGGTVRGGVQTVVGIFSALPGRITGAVGDLSGLLYHAGQAIIQGLINGIESMLASLWDKVGSIASKIASIKGPLDYDRRLLIPHGRAIIGGLQVGMENALPDVYALAGAIAPTIRADVRPAPVATAMAAPSGAPQVTVERMEVRDATDVNLVARELARRLGA